MIGYIIFAKTKLIKTLAILVGLLTVITSIRGEQEFQWNVFPGW